jgi:transposase
MTEISIFLDIPEITVLGVERTKRGDYHISVSSTNKGTHCRKCGKFIEKFHGYDKEIVLRHLPILDNEVYIHIKPQRFQCPYCSGKPTTTQKSSWYSARSPYTKAYEEYLLRCLINTTVEDVSIKENIGYESMMGVLKRHVNEEVNWDTIKNIDVLGIDEASLKKGHKDFVTIVTGYLLGKVRILGVLEGRKKETVEDFLRGIPERLKKTIKYVCSDMYEGFVNAAYSIFGKDIKVVIDRFHVAKKYRECLDNLRKKEMGELKRWLPEEDYKELKGAMWIVRKKESELTEEEKKVRENLFIYSPTLKEGYDLSNKLTEIFNENYTKIEGAEKIRQWIKDVKESSLTCFDSFTVTLENWLDEISNYFERRLNSGFVEGLNNKIKVIKRRCYGIFNIKHLFQRIYLDLEGYTRFLWLQKAY